MGGSNATFTLGGNYNSFGLTWASIDSYNTLTVSDSRGRNLFGYRYGHLEQSGRGHHTS